MPRLYGKKKIIGLPPGTWKKSTEKLPETEVSIIEYDAEHFEEKVLDDPLESVAYRDRSSMTWINIDGRDSAVIDMIDEHFDIHPLVVEDIINTGQRPKLEDYGKNLFIVLKMLTFNEETRDVQSEQLGFVLGDNYLLTFQERKGDVFDSVRERLRKNKGRVRKLGSDYLAYALIDTIVDHYFTIIEKIGDEIEFLDEAVMKDPDEKFPQTVHQLKRMIIFLRKQIWPLREVIGELQRTEHSLITKNTKIYFRDVQDHTFQVIDSLEALRDSLSGMQDIYLSQISHKMNEVMKVLTVFSTVFIPLSFLTGLYGMNFEYIPELQYRYGYFVLIGVMGVLTLGMLVFFRQKKWF